MNDVEMRRNIPSSEGLSTSEMNRVFDSTTATYKFYWLLALLDMFVKEHKSEIPALEIASKMVAYAWYPIEYFKLSFGRGDSMAQIIPNIAELTGITVDEKLENKTDDINKAVANDKRVKKSVKILLGHVPFWFQQPWINTRDKKDMLRRSQLLENDCLYSLSGWGDNLTVSINPKWNDYLNKNYEILRDFTLWNLTLFLQSKNPNVPNISGKLLRFEKREPLTRQKKFWNKVIEMGGEINCIYTGKLLGVNEYNLDHFMPWSFVSHNQNWNLIPADGRFNAKKNNLIPELNYYLPKMAFIQHHALRLYLPFCSKRDTIVNEYYALGASPQELLAMSDEEFLSIFHKTFSPLSQMATNMGFQTLKHE